MKDKLEHSLPRLQLADYFEELAVQLRSGRVKLGDEVWPVPETLEVKVLIKDKKGVHRFKLEWRGSTLTGYDAAAQREVVAWQANFKEVKKKLARSFKELKQALNTLATPGDATLQDFAALSRAFVEMADAEWSEAAREYLEHLDNLFRAIQQGQRESVVHELHDLENRMVACHKEFR